MVPIGRVPIDPDWSCSTVCGPWAADLETSVHCVEHHPAAGAGFKNPVSCKTLCDLAQSPGLLYVFVQFWVFFKASKGLLEAVAACRIRRPRRGQQACGVCAWLSDCLPWGLQTCSLDLHPPCRIVVSSPPRRSMGSPEGPRGFQGDTGCAGSRRELPGPFQGQIPARKNITSGLNRLLSQPFWPILIQSGAVVPPSLMEPLKPQKNVKNQIKTAILGPGGHGGPMGPREWVAIPKRHVM